MGRFFYPLQYIPTSSGEKKTLPLRSHSGKSERGFVTVNLEIDEEVCTYLAISMTYIYSTSLSLSFSPSLQSCLSDFAVLTCAMVNVSAKESGGYVRRWNGRLTPMAEKILEEYAALNDIDELYTACM